VKVKKRAVEAQLDRRSMFLFRSMLKHGLGAVWRPGAFLIEITRFITPARVPSEAVKVRAAPSLNTISELKLVKSDVKIR
jgi:hypothetical protein